jgi:hypothetical protein
MSCPPAAASIRSSFIFSSTPVNTKSRGEADSLHPPPVPPRAPLPRPTTTSPHHASTAGSPAAPPRTQAEEELGGPRRPCNMAMRRRRRSSGRTPTSATSPAWRAPRPATECVHEQERWRRVRDQGRRCAAAAAGGLLPRSRTLEMELAGLGAPSRWSRGSAALPAPLLPLLLRAVEGGKKLVAASIRRRWRILHGHPSQASVHARAHPVRRA